MSRPVWYRSLYWRIAFGFIALLAVVLGAQFIIFLWLTDRIVGLLGVEGAKRRAAALIDDGCGALDEVGLLTPALERIARFSVERTS